MNDINLTILVGKLGNDPKEVVIDTVKHPHAINTKAVKFRLFTKKYKKNKEDDKTTITTETHKIKAFSQNAIYSLEKLKKDSRILVIGEIHYHSYKLTDGTFGENTEIIAQHIIDFKQDKKLIKEKLMTLVESNEISADTLEKVLSLI